MLLTISQVLKIKPSLENSVKTYNYIKSSNGCSRFVYIALVFKFKIKPDSHMKNGIYTVKNQHVRLNRLIT